MKKISLRWLFVSLILMGSMVSLFQNCGPAKLSGNTQTSTTANLGSDSGSTLGTKVNLASLLNSAQENSANVLYPSSLVVSEYDYAQGSPIIENIVLLKNDFSRIEWVHGPSSTVIALGDTFNQKIFSSDLLGFYYVFGYRGQIPFLITQFRIVNKGPTSLSVNSQGAVLLTQKVIASDMQNESILVQMDAPSVDLTSVQFTLKSSGVVITGKRAFLVTKKLSESVDIEMKLSDMLGQTLSSLFTLAAKSTPTPTPTPGIAINVGGSASGSFIADKYYSGGTVASNVPVTTSVDTSGATNPAPQAVYHNERYGNFTYTIPGLNPNGIYQVRLHFVESYWPGAGQRSFNVAINGVTALSNFDIFANTGAMNKLMIQSFNVFATAGGSISIQFSTIIDNAIVDAIEILPTSALLPGIATNVGGAAAGSFIADKYYSGGTMAANVPATTSVDTSGATNPAPQAVYHNERYGNFTYTIPNLTPSSLYQVRLHFVESYWSGADQRSFNVAINGATVLSNFDIFANTGAMNKLVIQSFNVFSSAGGNISIQFTTVKDNAIVDAIEVLSTPSTLP